MSMFAGRVFDLDNPRDVAALVHIDRMMTQALHAEKALRALTAIINSQGIPAALARLGAEVRQPVDAWENEGGAL